MKFMTKEGGLDNGQEVVDAAVVEISGPTIPSQVVEWVAKWLEVSSMSKDDKMFKTCDIKNRTVWLLKESCWFVKKFVQT